MGSNHNLQVEVPDVRRTVGVTNHLSSFASTVKYVFSPFMASNIKQNSKNQFLKGFNVVDFLKFFKTPRKP